MPYCYLNYTDGTGDGLDWAIENGLVDPSAFAPLGDSGGGGDGGLASFAAPASFAGPQEAMMAEGADGRSVEMDYSALSTSLGRDITMRERANIDQALADNGNFSLFTGVTTSTTRRRDRYMFPLNTDYDLFSLGPDHATATSLGESTGLDDVIRANNGGFFGLASNY